MEKREKTIYISFVVLILIFLAFYFSNLPFTGFAVLSQYTTESNCIANGYTWENLTEENCTTVTNCVNITVDCEPCLTYEDINGTQGACISWSSCIEENCTNEEQCVDVITGGQCTGDVCDATHLNLCLDETGCAGAGGYWYDSVCNTEEEEVIEETNVTNNTTNESSVQVPVIPPVEVVETTELSASEISALSLNPGKYQDVTWTVTNTGTLPLNTCTLKAGGDYALWLSFADESINLGAGEQKGFVISVLIPEETGEGSYSFDISAECAETAVSKGFSVNVAKEKLGFDILSAERTRKERVRVYYSLEELSGEDQNVELYFSLLDSAGQEVSNASANRSIDANSTGEYKINLPINQSLEGNLTLSASYGSEIYSSSVQEPIMLGAPVGGFAVFGGTGTGSIIILAVVVLALIAILVIVKIRKKTISK